MMASQCFNNKNFWVLKKTNHKPWTTKIHFTTMSKMSKMSKWTNNILKREIWSQNCSQRITTSLRTTKMTKLSKVILLNTNDKANSGKTLLSLHSEKRTKMIKMIMSHNTAKRTSMMFNDLISNWIRKEDHLLKMIFLSKKRSWLRTRS